MASDQSANRTGGQFDSKKVLVDRSFPVSLCAVHLLGLYLPLNT